MNINGKTRTSGLIGNPVEHTMSPVIHNTLSERKNCNMAYVPLHVETGRLSEAVKGAYALNLLGCNVTVPYKTEVIKELVSIEETAQTIGAVNTLVRVDGGFRGYNTDMPGLYRAMQQDGIKLEGESILILGAGGVARAAAVMAVLHQVKEVIILNRSLEKARSLAEDMNKLAKKDLVKAKTYEEYVTLDGYGETDGKKYLAIQATSIGMYPSVDEAILEEKEFYQMLHTGYDLIFNPYTTKFMKLVRENGGKAYNGLKMLLYQGIIAFELWNRILVEDEIAIEIYDKMKKELEGESE